MIVKLFGDSGLNNKRNILSQTLATFELRKLNGIKSELSLGSTKSQMKVAQQILIYVSGHDSAKSTKIKSNVPPLTVEMENVILDRERR